MRTLLVVSILILNIRILPAFEVQEGYFQGINLDPISGAARAAVLKEEPAAVVIFTLDPANSAAVARFDEWFRQPGPKGISIYGVIAEPDKSAAVVSEVINQRDLQLPLFFTNSRILGGEQIRVVFVNNGRPRIMPSAEPSAVRAELVKGTSTATEPSLSSTRPSLAQASPTSAVTTVEVVTETTGTTTTAVVEDSVQHAPVYINARFNLNVRFPEGWPFVVARNGDGAVAQAPPGSQLDLRVWATRAGDEYGQPARTPREYAEQHLEFLGSQVQSDVVAERRLMVNDGPHEGRDYTYRYTKPSSTGRSRVLWRGRVQVFLVDGIFKVAAAEAPAEEFNKSRGVIEEFVLSFHPTLETDEAIAPARPAVIGPAGAPVAPGPVPMIAPPMR